MSVYSARVREPHHHRAFPSLSHFWCVIHLNAPWSCAFCPLNCWWNWLFLGHMNSNRALLYTNNEKKSSKHWLASIKIDGWLVLNCVGEKLCISGGHICSPAWNISIYDSFVDILPCWMCPWGDLKHSMPLLCSPVNNKINVQADISLLWLPVCLFFSNDFS